MIVQTHAYDLSLSTDSYEYEDDTLWDGDSKITLDYLLDQAQDVPAISNLNDKLVEESQNTFQVNETEKEDIYTVGNKIIPIAKRLNAVISELPIEISLSTSTEVFQSIQEWEGYVVNVNDETFTARLIDTQNRDNPEEEGDFLIEDIRKDDLKMLQTGAVFRWVVGYVIKRDGAKRRSSDIVFRRLPQWTQRDLSEADTEAEEMLGAIDWQ